MYKYLSLIKPTKIADICQEKRKRGEDEDQSRGSSTKKLNLENKMLMFDPEGNTQFITEDTRIDIETLQQTGNFSYHHPY